ncbi:MAG: hypothetical protein ACKOTF_07425, partial [Opitutaceae bacterium]
PKPHSAFAVCVLRRGFPLRQGFLLRQGYGGQDGGQGGGQVGLTTDSSDITDQAPPAFTIFPVFLFRSVRSLRTFGSAERPSVFIRAIREICGPDQAPSEAPSCFAGVIEGLDLLLSSYGAASSV